MGKSTISMVILNSYVSHYQRVWGGPVDFPFLLRSPKQCRKAMVAASISSSAKAGRDKKLTLAEGPVGPTIPTGNDL